jgi:hypothetical protein
LFDTKYKYKYYIFVSFSFSSWKREPHGDRTDGEKGGATETEWTGWRSVCTFFVLYAFGYIRRVFGGRQARVCRIWEGREIFMMGASPGASSGWNGNGTGIDM